VNLFSAILKALPEGVLYGTYIINIVIVTVRRSNKAAETDRLEAMPRALPEGVLYGTYIINIVIVTVRRSNKAAETDRLEAMPRALPEGYGYAITGRILSIWLL